VLWARNAAITVGQNFADYYQQLKALKVVSWAKVAPPKRRRCNNDGATTAISRRKLPTECHNNGITTKPSYPDRSQGLKDGNPFLKRLPLELINNY